MNGKIYNNGLIDIVILSSDIFPGLQIFSTIV